MSTGSVNKTPDAEAFDGRSPTVGGGGIDHLRPSRTPGTSGGAEHTGKVPLERDRGGAVVVTDRAPRWPDFLLIGAAKAGTTALFLALGRHPRVYFPQRKEPRYLTYPDVVPQFIGPGAKQNIRSITSKQADYLALFAECPGDAVAGEASTQYLADEGTPANAARFVPEARLIVVLRHPVERAYSQYLQMRQEGSEPAATFEEAWSDGDRRIAEGWRSALCYAQRGHYAEHLARWLRHFPRERLLVLFYEDWLAEPSEVLAMAWRHLGLEPLRDPVVTRENVSSRQPRWAWLHHRMADPHSAIRLAAQRILPLRVRDALTRSVAAVNLVPGPRLDPGLRTRLARTYHDDLDRLEALTGRDLSAWRS